MLDPFAIFRALATLGAAVVVGTSTLLWYSRDALVPAGGVIWRHRAVLAVLVASVFDGAPARLGRLARRIASAHLADRLRPCCRGFPAAGGSRTTPVLVPRNGRDGGYSCERRTADLVFGPQFSFPDRDPIRVFT